MTHTDILWLALAGITITGLLLACIAKANRGCACGESRSPNHHAERTEL